MATTADEAMETPSFSNSDGNVVEKPTPLMPNGLPAPGDNLHSINENNANGFAVTVTEHQHVDVNMAEAVHHQFSAKPSSSSLNFPLTVQQQEKFESAAPLLPPATNDPRHAELFDIFRTLASSTDGGGTAKLLQHVTNYVYGDNNDIPAREKEVPVKIEPTQVTASLTRTSTPNNRRSMQKAVRRLLVPSATALPPDASTTNAGSPHASGTMLLNAVSILHRTAERRKDDALKERNDNVLDDMMDTGEVSQRLALVRLPIKMLESKIQMVDTVKLHQQQLQQQKVAIEEQGGSAQKRLAIEKPPAKSLELERKYIKMKTANFYKRDNYNMLREASEGFSSLFYNLIVCKPPSNNMSPGQQQLIKSSIVDHVGYYEIDCFKVLELSLMACLFNVYIIDMVIEYAALLRPEPALLARFACRPMSFIAAHSSLLPTAATAKTNAGGKGDTASPSDGKNRPSPVHGSNKRSSRDRSKSRQPGTASTSDVTATETSTAAAAVVAVDHQAAEERDATKASLYENAGLLLARLVESELLGFDHIMSYVNELEEKPLDKIWEEANEEARQYADNLTSTILSAVTADDGAAGGPKEADDFDSSAAAATDNKDRRKKSSRFQLALSLNLKVQIASAFLQHWHIDRARHIVDLRQASAYLPIARCLSEMLTYSIDLLYRDAVLAASRLPSSSSQQQQQSFYAPFRPVYVNKQHHFSIAPKSGMQLPVQLTSASQLDSLSPILGELNANLYIDCVCMHRLLLVVENHFRKSTSSAESQPNSPAINEWIAWMFEICLLPAMSLTQCNVSLANALWQCGLQYLPYEIRFLLYHRWADFGYGSHPELCRVRGEIRADLKYAVKRLSKDKKSMEKFGRLLAKLSTCHPVLAHPYVLSRVESFGELTPIIVESFKYQFSMSLDALQFCMISYLADPVRAGVKHDKITIRPWFVYICEFLAQATRKVPVDMCGILHFIVAELKDGKTVDLLVLKKLIEKISGIESSDDVTDEQLQALTGGTVLQQEVFCAQSFRVSRKVTNRFRDALISQDLTLPLALLLVMQKNREIYAVADDKHLKLVGTMYDMCHDTLTQFCVYLSHIFTPRDFAATMPTIADLCIQFKVPPDIALYLLRPLFFQAVKDELTAKLEAGFSTGNVLTHSVSTSSLPHPKTLPALVAPSTATDDLESLVFTKPVAVAALPSTSATRTAITAAMADVDVAEKLRQANQFFDRWQQKLQPTAQALRPLIRHIVMDVTPQFFVLFWTLSPHDLYVPSAAYDQVWKKLEENLRTDEHKSSHDMSSKRRKEREKIRFTVAELKAEKKLQVEHVDRVVHCLRRWSEAHLFTDSSRTRKNDFILQFIQVCLFPRCMFAPEEARFCAQFIQTIHELRTPFFSTVICYDRVLCDIRGMLMSCSEKEASRFGRMLHAALDTVMRWWSSPSIFEKECRGHPGFVTKVRSSGTAAAPNPNGGVDDEDEVTYDNYRHLVYKWHFKLTKTMVDCIDSRDYMQVRNALTILTHLPPHFPKLLNFYASLEKKIDALRVLEDKKHANRPDLFALATSYSSRLKQQKSLCVLEEQFHLKQPHSSAASTTSSAASDSNKRTPQEQRGTGPITTSAAPSRPKENAVAAAQPQPSKTAEQTVPKSSNAAPAATKQQNTTDASSHQQPKPTNSSTASNKPASDADAKTSAAASSRREGSSSVRESQSQRNSVDTRNPTSTATASRPSSTSPVAGSNGDRRSHAKNDGSTSTRREKSSAIGSSPEDAVKSSSKHHDQQQPSGSSRAQQLSANRDTGGDAVKRDEKSNKRSSSRADENSSSSKRSAATATNATTQSAKHSSSSTSAPKPTNAANAPQTSQQQQSSSSSRPQQSSLNDEKRQTLPDAEQPQQRRPSAADQQQRAAQSKRPLEQSSSNSSVTATAAPNKQQHSSGTNTSAKAPVPPSSSSTTSPSKKLKTASESGAPSSSSTANNTNARSGAMVNQPQQPRSSATASSHPSQPRKVSSAAQEFEFSSDEDEPVNNNTKTLNTHSNKSTANPPPPPPTQPQPRSAVSSSSLNRTSSNSGNSKQQPPPPRLLPPPPSNTAPSQNNNNKSNVTTSRQPPPPLPAASRKTLPSASGAAAEKPPPPPPMASQQRRTSTGDGRAITNHHSSSSSSNIPPNVPRTATSVQRSTSSENHNAARAQARPMPPPPTKTTTIAQQHEDIDDDEDDDFDVADVFDQA